MTAVALHNPAEQRSVSVIASMASDYGMRAEAFEQTLRATVVPKSCTREEFAAFVLVARQYKLNPITREIYAVPKKGGGIQPVVGVDGWYSIMNDHPAFDGIEFEDILDDEGRFCAVTCRIWRKDRSRPVIVTEYLAECRQGTEPWQKWPRRMTRHKSGIQCARVAFGFSGIVDPDEADRFKADGSAPSAQVRELKTIDARLADFAADAAPPDNDTNFAAAQSSPAAEPPAQGTGAGEPPASTAQPDAGGAPEREDDPLERARRAGRAACRAGVAYEAIPKEFARYKTWAEAWRDGYQDEGERVEAEMNQ